MDKVSVVEYVEMDKVVVVVVAVVCSSQLAMMDGVIEDFYRRWNRSRHRGRNCGGNLKKKS